MWMLPYRPTASAMAHNRGEEERGDYLVMDLLMHLPARPPEPPSFFFPCFRIGMCSSSSVSLTNDVRSGIRACEGGTAIKVDFLPIPQGR